VSCSRTGASRRPRALAEGRRALVRVPFLGAEPFWANGPISSTSWRADANGTLHIGAANNLALRAHRHRTGVGSTFTTKYGVKTLVWYEQYGDVIEAIAREKQLKTWERNWKLALEHFNRDWRDLYEQLNA
jgi:putative endonuclease